MACAAMWIASTALVVAPHAWAIDAPVSLTLDVGGQGPVIAIAAVTEEPHAADAPSTVVVPSVQDPAPNGAEPVLEQPVNHATDEAAPIVVRAPQDARRGLAPLPRAHARRTGAGRGGARPVRVTAIGRDERATPVRAVWHPVMDAPPRRGGERQETRKLRAPGELAAAAASASAASAAILAWLVAGGMGLTFLVVGDVPMRPRSRMHPLRLERPD